LNTFYQAAANLTFSQIAAIATFAIVVSPILIFIINNPRGFAKSVFSVANGFFVPIGKLEHPNFEASQLAKEVASYLKKDLGSMLETKVEPSEPGEADNVMHVTGNVLGIDQHNVPQWQSQSFPNIAYRLAKPSTMLMETISWKLNKPDPERSIQELLDMHSKVVEEETRWRQQTRLEEVFDQQLSSASRIRGLMINLFVVVNFAVMCFILFRPEQVLNSKELVFGLYISFATFMVYVFRSTNARALILLAGQEDLKRYHDAERYLKALKARGPSDKDIDVLKLLLINRMEREKNGEHPYELVLKGISNSNILFKGGKIATPSKERPKKDES
jgi:hypothetical protein